MIKEIAAIEPTAIWHHFAQLNAVPRPSKKEEKVQAFIIDFAKQHGLSWKQDQVGNILVEKPASAGMENRRKVVLQAHLDMVCQKNADVDFDFETQGINMYIDGDWVKAKGTTLGADNGIGVATIMATLASKDIAHPPLEALFTTDEEAGMTGAHHLQPGFLSGEILMNLDTEDDDELSIGCAGGIDTDITWTYPETAVPSDWQVFDLSLRGLAGGHSGMDIILGRGNANKIMNRLIFPHGNLGAISLLHFEGGGLRNAIPREAHAKVAVAKEAAQAWQKHWSDLGAALQAEFATTDPGFKLAVEQGDAGDLKMMEEASFKQFSYALQATHDGILRMSPDVEDLVETSNNVANVVLGGGAMKVVALQRSDRESAKFNMADTIGAPWRILGAEVKHSGSYPGWKLDPKAPMLGMMQNLYQELFKEEPRVIACHAGLECGLLGQHYPELEMISFGPTIKDPHSPDEKVSISSVQKFWHYYQEALKRVPVKA